MPLYSLNGRHPQVPASGRYWIAPNAVVIGDVVIGEDCGLWFGVTARGDNERIVIGARSNIQEGTTLHTDMGSPLTIGEGCTVGHNAILHGCVIGDGSLVGMGAIVLNGARIGRNCLIGAGALVTEGKEFPDGSLIVGSPAVAKRPLSPAALACLAKSASSYAENARRYAAQLREWTPE